MFKPPVTLVSISALRSNTARSSYIKSLRVLEVLLRRFVRSGLDFAALVIFVRDEEFCRLEIDDPAGPDRRGGGEWWKLFAPNSLMAVTGSLFVRAAALRRSCSLPRCQKKAAKPKQSRLIRNHVRVFKCIGRLSLYLTTCAGEVPI